MNWLGKRKKTEHQYVEEQLSAYLDGELSARERQAVERHLATCQACRWNLNTLRQTVQWTSQLPAVRVPRSFTIPVPAQPVRAARRSRFVPALQAATALVALLLFFVVAGDVMLTGFQSVGRRSAEPQMLAVEATRSVQDEAVQAVAVETVVVEKEAEPLVAQEAPRTEALATEQPVAAEMVAGESAAEESAKMLEVAPSGAATVTAAAALNATMAPPGMGGGAEEAEGEAPAEPAGDARALTAAPTDTAALEAPAVPPTPTALATLEPQPTQIAMPAPSPPVEVGEALSVPQAAESERSYAARPATLNLVRWGEYILGVLLILLLGTTIGAMVWRRSRDRD